MPPLANPLPYVGVYLDPVLPVIKISGVWLEKGIPHDGAGLLCPQDICITSSHDCGGKLGLGTLVIFCPSCLLVTVVTLNKLPRAP